ncbi:MAG: HTH DNA binding domain protein [Methanomassiliicoccales archaeon PtaU1.Bin124]|nr:MAG: HTH DNA binding domain protein [Methanomassiliicoccales archaeon PtaU1.Bin124]
MMEVEFDILNMDGWISSVASNNLCSIKILDCIPWQGIGGQARFSLTSNNGSKVLKEISQHPDISSIEAEELNDGTIHGSVGMRNCGLIRTILSSGCFLELASSEGDGIVRMKITSGSEGSIPALIKKLDEMGLIVEIRRLSRMRAEPRLNRHQEELVKRALDEGYYDIPRRITAKQLAEKCDVATSTLRESLVRAERAALKKYLEINDEH